MIGQIVPSLARNIPDGYIECNGQKIKKADYPEFFEKLGITEDSYNVPNLNRFYITIGHAGTSTFNFIAHEKGDIGQIGLGCIKKHKHGYVSFKRYKSKTAYVHPIAEDDDIDDYETSGPAYTCLDGMTLSPAAKAVTAGDAYGNDACIIVKYLIGVK